MVRLFAALVLVAALTGFTVADSKYALTGDNTSISFVGMKKNGKHDGGFKKVTGAIVLVEDDLASGKIDVEIETESLYADNEKLTAHLKSPDFFGVKANPKATFVSTKIEKDKEAYTVTGDLTLLGKTKSISFPAKASVKDGELTLTSDFKINRTDFGMTFGRAMIDAEVAIKVSVKAKK